MLLSESKVVVMTGDHLVSEGSNRDRSLSVMDRCCAFRGLFERQIRHTKGDGQCRPPCDGEEQRGWGPNFTVPVG
jgi:hypothetical protein